MLLSRFWYVVLALTLGAAVFVLFTAQAMFNRHSMRATSESLSADSSAVGWYLKDDARRRASALLPASLNPDLRDVLSKASDKDEVSDELRSKAKAALSAEAEKVPKDLSFTAFWAVDARGRVIAALNYEHAKDWQLGGYAVVADALHGWVRDDTWVWDESLYKIVARPIQQAVGEAPVGALIGARKVDDQYAANVSRRTGAAVGFYVAGQRVASAAPEGFAKANLDQITQDLKQLDDNTDYQEKGRSEVRLLGEHLGVVYARMPGEAWDLGGGYAVGRLSTVVDTPLEFLEKADEADQEAVPVLFIGLGVLMIGLLGIVFSVFEHTMPISTFRREVAQMAEGKLDVLSPSRFRGVFKKIASDVNDGVEKVAAKGGAPRRAADLEEVLGPIPAEPSMSAFSVPGEGAPASVPGLAMAPAPAGPKALPKPKLPAPPRPLGGNAPPAPAPAGPSPAPPGPPPSAPGAPPSGPGLEEGLPEAATSSPGDELAEWRAVYEEFLETKRKCGESTASLTFEKFRGTLERNKQALVSRHQCSRVKFTVYVKEGKAALKASPVK